MPSRVLVLLLAGVATLLALAPAARAHGERPAFFPDGSGSFPKYRVLKKSDRPLVVCKPDSRSRIVKLKGHVRRKNLRLLRRCRFEHVQQAIDAARNGDRITILPGVYREEPSREKPVRDPACAELLVDEAGPRLPTDSYRKVASYEHEIKCPHSQNLIFIGGDSDDADRKCDRKCDLLIEGTGAKPEDVVIEGDRRRLNTIKADRADGIYLRNFLTQYSDFNNIYVLETDGFRFSKIITRWSREYGILTFTSDHGIYEDIDAYGHGDSGVYPGSGPDRYRNGEYGIILRRIKSHDNVQGTAGSAGNGLLFEDNDFYDNAAGSVVDSFSTGHPGSPQDNAKWVRNRIHDNNREDLFSAERDAYCKKPPLDRDPKVVCPAFQVPVGTGLLIAGGNDNIVEDNWIYGNKRWGVASIWVEAIFRAEYDPTKLFDTSHANTFRGNRMGVTPGGKPAPNRIDFFWDEQGARNCWQQNTAAEGARVTSDPAGLPTCPGVDLLRPVNPVKHLALVPCATWDEQDNTDPVGCDWFELPRSGGGRRR